MNLHISYDEKFLDPFIENAKRYTNSENVYIVIDIYTGLKYVKTKDVIVCQPEVAQIEVEVQKLSNIKRVYFHSFSPLFAVCSELIVFDSVKKHLLFYGVELFGLKQFEGDFFLPKTKKYIKNIRSEYFKFRWSPIEMRREIINYSHYSRLKKQNDQKITKALEEFHAVGHFIEDDVKDYIQKVSPSIKWINWNFFGMDVGADKSFKQDPENLDTLLLGNSASPFNNHFDALAHLEGLVTDLKIVAPLSYSGAEKYIKKVAKEGDKRFGSSFQPLLDFLPMEEYFALMKTVKAAVYFNLRSQAAGNILWLLTNNIPVFMLEENNLYKMLKQSGIEVYSVEKDLEEFLINAKPFTAHLKNSESIKNVFGEQAMKKKYVNLLA